MTVSSTANVAKYRGNGATTVFAFPFLVLEETDLIVALQSYATGEMYTPLVAGQYTITGLGLDAGGSVTITPAIASTFNVVLERRVPYTQLTDIVNQSGFYPEDVERQFDLNVMQVQQLKEILDRTVKFPIGEVGGVLPAETARAGMFLGFDAGGDVTVLSGTGADSALRTDLVADGGSLLFKFLAGGVGAEARTGQAKLRDSVNLKDFGVTANGVTNDTAKILSAFDSGEALVAPRGTMIVDPLEFPNDANGFSLIGAGQGRTIFQASGPNQLIMKQEAAGTTLDHAYFAGFSLKAHSSGSSVPAWQVSGFRNCQFERISGLSNGTGGFDSLFLLEASPELTYSCSFNHCGVANQTNILKAWTTYNNGLGAAYNPNVITIFNAWVYANTGMTSGMFLANSTGVAVIGGLIESAGDYGIVCGSKGYYNNIWLEANAIAPLLFQNTESVVSANNKFDTVFLSGFSGSLAIPADCIGNKFDTVTGDEFTIVPANTTVTPVLDNTPVIPVPTLAQVGGTASTITPVTTYRSPADSSWTITVDITPGAGVNTVFRLTPASGYAIRKLSVGVVETGAGAPRLSEPIGTDFYVAFANTNVHRVVIQVGFQ